MTALLTIPTPYVICTPDMDRSSWNPKLAEFFDYWLSIKPAEGLPGRQHFDPLAVVALMPDLWMLGVDEASGRYHYRLVGTRVVEAMGRDVTGRWYDEVHPDAAAHPMAEYLRARILAGEVTWRRGRPWLQVDPEIYEIEQVLLPLARDGRTVDMLLAITVFIYAGGAGSAF